MDKLVNWAQNSSLHGVSNAVLASKSRTLKARVIWLALFLVFTSICIYFQSKLFYQIVVEKPTVVELKFERSKLVNFPNIVICDLNLDLEKFLKLTENLGNFGLLGMQFIQLSFHDLYQVVRMAARENLTNLIEKYPLLDQQYRNYYNAADDALISMFGKYSIFKKKL